MTTDIEKKLLEYRTKKKREEYVNSIKQRTKDFFLSLVPQKPPVAKAETQIEEYVEAEEETEDLLPADEATEPEDIDETPLLKCTVLDYVYYFLCFTLWATLYAIFIKLQFGTVYLLVSGLVLMYLNTRTGPKRKHEVSAYSVFNKNCESIPGTLKAEQFEREMRYGAGAVR